MHEAPLPQGMYREAITWEERVTLYRSRYNLTKAQFAEVLESIGHDVTRQTLWRIETGRVKASSDTRKAIEDGFAHLQQIHAAVVASSGH